MKKFLLVISIFIFSYAVVQAQSAVTSGTINNITQTTADVSGTADAESATTYGVVFTVADNAAFTNSVDFTATPSSVSGSGSTTCTASLSGLNPGTVYYFAIVLQTSGLGGGQYVADGGTQSFTTNAAPSATTGSASSIATTSATITGSANAHNNGTYDVYIAYRKDGVGIYTLEYAGTASGNTTQNYSVNVTGLDAGTDYFFATQLKQATTVIATSSPEGSFTTGAPPTVTTGGVSNKTNISVTLSGSGNANNTGDYSTYIAYRENGAPSWIYEAATPGTATSGGGNTNFSVDLSSLKANQDYEYMAILYDGTNEYDGAISTFTTESDPTVTTKPVVAKGQTTATIDGSANANSSGTYKAFLGYREGSTGNFTWGNIAPNISGSSTQDFSNLSLTGLNPGTYYEFQAAVSLNSTLDANDYYGTIENFTTDPAGNPVVKTGTINTLTYNTANIINNELTNDGGLVCDGGIVYGTSAHPTTSNSTMTSYTGENSTHAYSATLTGLSASTHYYARAYATNANGTGYDTDPAGEIDFYTSPSTSAHFSSISDLTDADHTTLTLNWSPGNGDGRLIVAFQKGTSATEPADGTTYAANANYTSGDPLGSGFVMYFGSGASSLAVTGLDGDVEDYDFYIYEYAGVTSKGSANINYKQDNPGFTSTDGTTFPIELLSFTAKSESSNVIIEWSTATETNNDYFEIERSTDAENFEVVKKLPGAGNSNEVRSYAIVDKANFTGTVYYRLKQTDFDGKTTTSFVIPVIIGADNSLQISNVINDNNKLSFVYNNSNRSKSLIELVDINGRIVSTKEIDAKDSQLIYFNMNGMSRGIYIIHISVDDKTITKKVVY